MISNQAYLPAPTTLLSAGVAAAGLPARVW
jgi:hypothetical protein